MQAGGAVGRICHQAAAPRRHLTAGEEIDARGAETTIGDIAGDDRVAVPAEDNGHGAVAAAWLPYRAAQADVSQQSLGHPGRRRIEVMARALEGRHMDGPRRRLPSGGARRRSGAVRIGPVERQTEWRRAHPSGTVVTKRMATKARLWLGTTNISRGLLLNRPAAPRASAYQAWQEPSIFRARSTRARSRRDKHRFRPLCTRSCGLA